MLIASLWLVGGLLFLALGAEGLVRGASSAGRRMGISPLVIGLTVVAYGTSAPELVVSLHAAIGGNPDIAIGNVVGSNISNIGLILGLVAVMVPIRIQAHVLRLDVAFMIAASALFLGLVWDGVIGRLNGLVLIAGACMYTVICVWSAREETTSTVRQSFDDDVVDERSILYDLTAGVVGLLLLVLGARFLVTGAVQIAEAAGLSTLVIGLTVVAVGTSLPELATSAVAALRGHADLALGNVLGSNIFNLVGILGVTAAVHPLDASGVMWLDAGVMFGFAALTLPLFWTKYTFSRWEGALLITGYVGYVGALLWGVA